MSKKILLSLFVLLALLIAGCNETPQVPATATVGSEATPTVTTLPIASATLTLIPTRTPEATSIPTSASTPTLLPEDQVIAFKELQGILPAPLYLIGSNFQVMRLNPDSTLTQITQEENGIYHMDVSPADGRVAYTVALEKGARPGNRLVVVDRDGQNPLALVDGFTVSDPVWSPDGERIAYVGHFNKSGTSPDDVCLVNLDGSGYVRLENDSNYEMFLAWSAEDRIAYVATQGDFVRIEIIAIDGSGICPLLRPPVLSTTGRCCGRPETLTLYGKGNDMSSKDALLGVF